jgi:asparagine synthase (glutamine-hydrolysing)
MCGIAGIYYKTDPEPDREKTVLNLLKPINYRGPDNTGIVTSNKICLGHLRLSIIDLSSEANQPMFSFSKNGLIIVFNGEIYNYIELRNRLSPKYNFRTSSDTEVILNAYLEWGENCVNEFNGMWAFAIYDSSRNKLFCSRDRFGIKPFYYYHDKNRFVFASEIKCFRNLNNFAFSENISAIADNLIYGPLSFGQTQINDIYELESGTNLTLENNSLHTTKYFSLENTFDNQKPRYDLGHIEYLIGDSVRLRLRSDVPVATLNSGGLDSSLLSAIVKKNKPDLRTFSVAPEKINGIEQVGDESRFAQYLAEYIEAEIYTLRYSETEFKKLLNHIVYLNDGELYHSNSVPLFLLFKEIKKQGITVVLSGEGADEVFRGYSSNYRFLISKIIPKIVFLELLKKRIKGKEYFIQHFDNYRSSVSMINSLYVEKKKVLKHFNTGYEILPERKELFYIMNNLSPESANTYFEQKTYLAGLLRRLDRMSMANSIESRVPFLDYRIVEYMNKIPLNKKIGLTQNSVKLILKRIAKGYIPESIINRVKQGFSTPVHHYSFSNNNMSEVPFSQEELWYMNSINIQSCKKDIMNIGSRFFAPPGAGVNEEPTT